MITTEAPLHQSRPAQVVQHLRGPRHGRPAIVAATAAEATRTPGLVITPRMGQDIGGGWYFTGGWTVCHQHSGRVVLSGGPGAGLGHARDLAALLAELDVDWTQPGDTLPLRDPAVRAAVGELHERMWAAIREARPARLLDTSWREIPPPYWVGHEPGDTDLAFRTWSEAAEFLTTHGGAAEWGDAVIGREPTPVWDLICAALDCQTRPLDGEIGWMFHRRDLADLARDEGWRRLDDHRWLCAQCSALFTPTR